MQQLKKTLKVTFIGFFKNVQYVFSNTDLVYVGRLHGSLQSSTADRIVSSRSAGVTPDAGSIT